MAFTVTLQASGKSFDVREGETVLEAAQRAGLALSYSCLAGVCGSCKATLIEGECSYPRNPPSALSAAERARDAVLLCQAVPKTDLVIAAREVASVEDLPRRELHVRVLDKHRWANDMLRLRLAPIDTKLRWLPGQYIDVLLADGKRRAFSIALAPHLGPNLELHVRHVAGGGFTSYVFDELKPGDTLRIEGPLGTFVPREDSERPLLFVAGGAGFAPIKALVEHFMHLGTRRPMRLYWGARRAEDLYLRDLPQSWTGEAHDFQWQPVLSEPQNAIGGARYGFVHEAVLQDHRDLSIFDIYMSGPPAMIDAGRRLFVDAGLPEDRLYYDSFDYAPDVLAQILGNRAGIHGL
ncbi:MAG TPA: 2Fe-2S iron-sulfur cluster-binding protein [Rhodanobacteraceae bacterium]|nr:2Fe-2S iron-sulfur cluster-binding protein [Rhodanobacteraceae bacterium]